jgi:hypothetical protein
MLTISELFSALKSTQLKADKSNADGKVTAGFPPLISLTLVASPHLQEQEMWVVSSR